MDSAYPSISNDAGDGLIATDIDDRSSTDCAEYAAGGLICAINANNSMDCANIKVSDDAADILIAIAIDAGNSTDFAEGSVGGLIANIDAGGSMNSTDKSSSDDEADGFIATPIDADGLISTTIYSTENRDKMFWMMILMG